MSRNLWYAVGGTAVIAVTSLILSITGLVNNGRISKKYGSLNTRMNSAESTYTSLMGRVSGLEDQTSGNTTRISRIEEDSEQDTLRMKVYAARYAVHETRNLRNELVPRIESLEGSTSRLESNDRRMYDWAKTVTERINSHIK